METGAGLGAEGNVNQTTEPGNGRDGSEIKKG